MREKKKVEEKEKQNKDYQKEVGDDNFVDYQTIPMADFQKIAHEKICEAIALEPGQDAIKLAFTMSEAQRKYVADIVDQLEPSVRRKTHLDQFKGKTWLEIFHPKPPKEEA